jgi:hypothetical protein
VTTACTGAPEARSCCDRSVTPARSLPQPSGWMDTVAGLPTHLLVVHAVVVGIPVMSLVTFWVAAGVARRASGRVGRAWFVVVADAALIAVTVLASRTGQHLQDQLGGSQVAARHAELAERMVWFTVALAALAFVVAVAASMPNGKVIARIAVVLVLGTAVASTYWVVRVGQSGTSAVWKGTTHGAAVESGG